MTSRIGPADETWRTRDGDSGYCCWLMAETLRAPPGISAVVIAPVMPVPQPPVATPREAAPRHAGDKGLAISVSRGRGIGPGSHRLGFAGSDRAHVPQHLVIMRFARPIGEGSVRDHATIPTDQLEGQHPLFVDRRMADIIRRLLRRGPRQIVAAGRESPRAEQAYHDGDAAFHLSPSFARPRHRPRRTAGPEFFYLAGAVLVPSVPEFLSLNMARLNRSM